jgi:hypothetical protein
MTVAEEEDTKVIRSRASGFVFRDDNGLPVYRIAEPKPVSGIDPFPGGPAIVVETVEHIRTLTVVTSFGSASVRQTVSRVDGVEKHALTGPISLTTSSHTVLSIDIEDWPRLRDAIDALISRATEDKK